MSTLLAVTEKRDDNTVVEAMREVSISKKYLPDTVIGKFCMWLYNKRFIIYGKNK